MDKPNPQTLFLGSTVIGALALVIYFLGFQQDTNGQLQARTSNQYVGRIVNSYPHDPQAFCQGLLFNDGFLFESTGRYGQSTLRKVELTSGKVLQVVKLDKSCFGEGLTLSNGRLVQLTWKKRVGFIYDATTLKPLGTMPYRQEGWKEGWGITTTDDHLVVSDGSSLLRFLDPDTMEVVKTVNVRDGNREVSRLNELEFVEGQIFANIWYSDFIARISPESGKITGWIDLRMIRPKPLVGDREAVLNGIAYDKAGKRLFVTGKNWPRVFEVKLVPR